MFIINICSTCFGHHYAHLQENKSEHCEGSVTFTVLAPYNAAPHNRYRPHPAEPAQHTTCSNTRLVILNMGIMMPETCWESIANKHLTVASCWFSLSLHNLLTMHGHRNPKSPCYISEYALSNIPSTAIAWNVCQSNKCVANWAADVRKHSCRPSGYLCYFCMLLTEFVRVNRC